MKSKKVTTRPNPLPIADSDRVLDIGGGMNPHPRADYVIDLEDFETLKSYGNLEKIGRFNSETWIVHDICSDKPFPFPDKYFDFAICTHVLEDIRDPLKVCREIQRIAKAGYIEIPSVESELTCNLESRHYVGRWHHRWLVEITEKGLNFRMKPHQVNGYWKTQIPRSWWRKNSASQIQGFLWTSQFECQEIYYNYDELEHYLETFVEERNVYPRYRYRFWDSLKKVKSIFA